jgi:phosphoglycolate phosphatase
VERTAILFDIDGTLIESGGAGARAWRRAFEDLYGTSPDIWNYSEAGMTDPQVGRFTLASVLGREPATRELAQLLGRRQHHLPEEVARSEGYRVMPGVKELLPKLSEEGYLLGITTGGTEAAAHAKLERAHLNRYFHFGGYGTMSNTRAELIREAIARAAALAGRALERDEVLDVGDTPLDLDGAKKARAVAVGVATGRFSREQLQEAGADFVLGSLEEALPL